MKVLLSIGLLFLYVHSAVSSALFSKKVADMINLPNFHLKLSAPPGNRLKRWAPKPDLSWINDLRHRAADAMNVVNMPDLHWNESLAAEARDMDRKCENVKHGPDYRFIMLHPDETARKMDIIRYALITKTPGIVPERVVNRLNEHFFKNTDNDSLVNWEFINPLQTQLGCDYSKCTGDFFGRKYTYGVMCAIGSSNTWQKEEKLPKIEHPAKDGKHQQGPASSGRSSSMFVKHRFSSADVSTWPTRPEESLSAPVQIALLLIIFLIFCLFAYLFATRQKQVSREPKLLENY